MRIQAVRQLQASRRSIVTSRDRRLLANERIVGQIEAQRHAAAASSRLAIGGRGESARREGDEPIRTRIESSKRRLRAESRRFEGGDRVVTRVEHLKCFGQLLAQ